MLNVRHRPISSASQRQRGMSLVELMVGITIGLFVVAAGTLLAANQLIDNSRLLKETQLQQDMRAAMDVMTRQIRRAGVTGDGAAAAFIAADTAGASGAFSVPQGVIELTGNTDIRLTGWLTRASTGGRWGFFLNGQRIMARLMFNFDEAAPSELTDPTAVSVTRFEITQTIGQGVAIPCPKLCIDGTRNCWPRMNVRSYQLLMEAQSPNDARVTRRVTSFVRVRNDQPQYQGGSGTQACPA